MWMECSVDLDKLALTLYPIETPFNTFANKADPDQAALVMVRIPLTITKATKSAFNVGPSSAR